MMRKASNALTKAFTVAEGVAIEKGDLVGVDTADGYLKLWADVATLSFAGVADDDATGDVSEGVTCAVDISGPGLEEVAVSGATTIASTGALVCASDEDDFHTAAAVNTLPVAQITRVRESGVCDVVLQSMKQYADMKYQGIPA